MYKVYVVMSTEAKYAFPHIERMLVSEVLPAEYLFSKNHLWVSKQDFNTASKALTWCAYLGLEGKYYTPISDNFERTF